MHPLLGDVCIAPLEELSIGTWVNNTSACQLTTTLEASTWENPCLGHVHAIQDTYQGLDLNIFCIAEHSAGQHT